MASTTSSPTHASPSPWDRGEHPIVGPYVDVHGLSDPGRVRERNEDHLLIADLRRTMFIRDTTLAWAASRYVVPGDEAKLLVVADGLGGHPGGDLASALAVSALASYVLREIPWVPMPTRNDAPAEEALEPLRRALVSCEAHLRAAGDGRKPPMGTTLTAALMTHDVLEVVHAGDSRCYLFRRGALTQVTRDHTVRELLRDHGADPTAYRHVLYNALGADDRDVVPELHRVELEPGDGVLLCSDGLTRHLSDKAIAAQLTLGSARACCQALVDAANQAGGADNITVIFARS